jgi:hypothetical protein
MISQSSFAKRRKKCISIVAIGTACNIVLQSGFCYSLAWAAPLTSTPNGSPPSSNETVLDEAKLLALGPAAVSPQANLLDTKIDSEPAEELLDSASTGTCDTPISGNPVLAIADPSASDLSVSSNGRLISEGTPTLSGSVSIDEVERLTKQTAAKIFELERLNTYFRFEGSHVSHWRKWRNFAGDEAAAQTVAAGVLVFIIYSLRGLHRGATRTVIKFHGLQIPGKFYKLDPNTRLEHGFITTIPGIWVGVLQETYELGENFYNDWRAKQRGFDPKTTRAKATQIQHEIDRLLAERASLVDSGSSTPQERELELAEGKVLKDMRDLALNEYIDYYTRAKRIRTYENMFYLTDIAERTTGFASLLMGLISLQKGMGARNRLASLGVLQIVSAILAPAAPINGAISSHFVRLHAQHSVEKDINGIDARTPEVFDADRKHLEDLVLNSGSSGSPVLASISGRNGLYRMEKENLEAVHALRGREHRDAKSAFWQSVGIRTFAFGNKTAFGSVAIAGGFTHLNNPRHFDSLLLGATTPYYVTLQASSVDALRRTVQGQMLEHSDRAKGNLPKQIYKARLARLDQMEALTNPTKRISLK